MKESTSSQVPPRTRLPVRLGLGHPHHPETGAWLKGNAVPSDSTHRAITREAVKPRRLWQGEHGVMLPVFIDDTPRLASGSAGTRPGLGAAGGGGRQIGEDTSIETA